jgi:hypothetical protein
LSNIFTDIFKGKPKKVSEEEAEKIKLFLGIRLRPLHVSEKQGLQLSKSAFLSWVETLNIQDIFYYKGHTYVISDKLDEGLWGWDIRYSPKTEQYILDRLKAQGLDLVPDFIIQHSSPVK